MNRTFSTGDRQEELQALRQGNREPWGCRTEGGVQSAWGSCAVWLCGREGGTGWSPKGISSLSFFCLFPKLLPPHCHLWLPLLYIALFRVLIPNHFVGFRAWHTPTQRQVKEDTDEEKEA